MIHLQSHFRKENENINKWEEIFGDVFLHESFSILKKQIQGDIVQFGEHLFCPRLEFIWEAFAKINPDDFTCLILSDEPYPNIKYAKGIAFAVPESIQAIPLSLQNIQNEIDRSIPNSICCISLDHELNVWTSQGVLPIHVSMSTLNYKPMAQFKLWQNFMIRVIEKISEKLKPFPIITFGKPAFETLSERTKYFNFVIPVNHPNSVQYNKVGCIGSNCFVNANIVLTDPRYNINKPAIQWNCYPNNIDSVPF